MFEIFHARQQYPGVPDQTAPGFQDQLLAAIVQNGQQRRDVFADLRWGFIVVSDAQASSEVQMLKLDALGGQGVRE